MRKHHLTKEEKKQATARRKLRKDTRAIKRETGFTLIELLIVLFILFIVFGVLFNGFKVLL